MKRIALTYSFAEKLPPYVEALRAAGLEVTPVHADANPVLEGFDGLAISGGTDLNPALYGEAPHAEAEEPDDPRDAMELRLLRDALARDVPVLAICRGMQLFNVALGGSLEQHIAECAIHRRYDLDKRLPVHPVLLEPDSRLAEILGEDPAAVNSRHHQAIARLGEGLLVSARSADGLIEGIELPGKRFAVGVQWHPEDQAAGDTRQAKLFQAFASAV